MGAPRHARTPAGSGRQAAAAINIIGIMVALATTVLPLGLLWMILLAEWMR